MSAVESPTGADPEPPWRPSELWVGSGFTRSVAAEIARLTPLNLRRWENLLLNQAGVDLGPTLVFSDLVALAVLSATVRCLGADADDYAVGIAQLFEALRGRADVERLDGYAALVGRDSGRLLTHYDTEHCAAADILIIPLRPILADFRGQVFA